MSEHEINALIKSLTRKANWSQFLTAISLVVSGSFWFWYNTKTTLSRHDSEIQQLNKENTRIEIKLDNAVTKHNTDVTDLRGEIKQQTNMFFTHINKP